MSSFKILVEPKRVFKTIQILMVLDGNAHIMLLSRRTPQERVTFGTEQRV